MNAQKKYTFENIYPDAKLSFGTIKTILEDENGFIWFGCSNGLYYYNSHEVIKQKFNNNQLSYLISIDVNIIYQDSFNNIWAGTENGLCKYNISTNQFDWITFNNDESFYTQIKINNIIQWDSHKYIILSGGMLFIYNSQNNKLAPFKILDNEAPGSISLVEKTSENTLIIGTQNGFIYTLKNIDSKPKKLYHRKQQAAKTICVDGNLYYIGFYESGVDVIDKNGRKISEFKENNEGISGLPSNFVRKILKRKNGEIWIATLDGILVVDGDKRIIIKSSQLNQLPSNVINVLYCDRKDDIWLGSRSSGIGFFSDLNYRFDHYHNIDTKDNFTSSVISSFSEATNGYIWIGSENHGMAQYIPEKNTLQPIPHLLEKKPLNIKALSETKDNKIWIGTFNEGIWQVDIAAKTPKRYNTGEENHTIPIISSISIYHDNLWIGTRRKGIYHNNIHGGETTNHDLSKLNLGNIESNCVWKTFVDSKNNLWICTESGLFIKKSNNNTIELAQNVIFNKSKIAQNKFLTICEDKNGKIWLGTNGSGVFIFNPEQGKFEAFKNNHLIINEQIYNILTDYSNNIWLSTSIGIFQHNQETGKTKQFSLEDGLFGGQYLPNSALASSSGSLFFGSSNGFSIINPQIIKINERVPEVFLSKLLINNKPLELYNELTSNTKHLANIKWLKLKHLQNALTFSFVTNNFIKPSKNKVKYRLINYQEIWSEVSNNGDIHYTKIPPGDYTLEVMGTNNDGVWSQSPLQVQISIAPPFWLSWHAYLLYLASTILITLLIVKELRLRYRLKREVIAERFKSEATEMLYNEKQKFFMNISHEFRTPLTLIISPINNLLDKFKNDHTSNAHLKLIKRNAGRLLRLTNQILDFNLIEEGKVKGKFEKTDFVELCISVCQHFEYQVIEKSISFTFNSTFKSLLVWVDPDMIEKILFNLISNAIKFSNENGQVNISIDKKEIIETEYEGCTFAGTLFSGESLELKITNYGKKIDPGLLPWIFERFTTDPKQETTGAGIGLHMSGEYARINNAFICVYSKSDDGGNTFVLNIPLTNDSHIEKNSISLHNIVEQASILPLSAVEISDELITKKVVLLAEDNLELRQYLRDELCDRYIVVTAKNGQLALDIAKEIMPDILVTDLSMPRLDGLELIKSLKDNTKTKQIPIIVLTALTQNNFHMESIVKGADSFLTKPIDSQILIAQIENIFKSRKMIEEKIIDSDKGITNQTDYDKKDITQLAEEIIEANFHNMQFGVEQLAQELKQSRSNLHRIIKTKTNQNTSEFIRDVRLKKSIQLLKEETMSMEEIAQFVGFNSISYFSRSFKKKYGQSPTDYIRWMKK